MEEGRKSGRSLMKREKYSLGSAVCCLLKSAPTGVRQRPMHSAQVCFHPMKKKYVSFNQFVFTVHELHYN